MLRLKSLSNTLSDLASAVQAEAEAAQANMEVVNNMCGLASLPNELVARIFDYVVNGDASLTNPNRWKAAVALSHVCQYFWETAVSCPQLWSNISRSSEIAASCLSRSKNAPLDVELMVTFGTGAFQNVLQFEQLSLGSLSHSSRWRSLGIQFMSMYNGVNRTPLGGSNIRQTFRGVDAPLLDSLHIKNDNPRKRLVSDL